MGEERERGQSEVGEEKIATEMEKMICEVCETRRVRKKMKVVEI